VKKSNYFIIVLFLFLFFLSFISAGNNWQLFCAKLAWSLLVVYCGFNIYRQNNISKYRSVLFILTAILFLLGFKVLRLLSLPKIDAPYCHIAQAPALFNFIHSQFLALTSGNWQVWGVLTLGFLWLLIMFTIGQGICSWVCFFGGIDEACSKLAKKPFFKLNISKTWRDFPLAFLIFLLIVSFFQGLPVFCSWFCPFKLTGAFWDSQPVIRIAQMAFFFLSLAAFVILLPVLTKKRTFCSLICPFGALASVFGRFTPYRVNIDKDKCIRCGKCFDICPVLAIERQGHDEYRISSYCNKCGKCIDVCPVKAINILAYTGHSGWQVEVREMFVFLSLLISGVVSGSFIPQVILQLLGVK
jgi:ferredoxin-type protein NapH